MKHVMHLDKTSEYRKVLRSLCVSVMDLKDQ